VFFFLVSLRRETYRARVRALSRERRSTPARACTRAYARGKKSDGSREEKGFISFSLSLKRKKKKKKKKKKKRNTRRERERERCVFASASFFDLLLVRIFEIFFAFFFKKKLEKRQE